MRLCILVILSLCVTQIAQAAYIQYMDQALPSPVTGVSDQSVDPVPGRLVAVWTGQTIAQIAWPSATGCGVGEPSWAEVVAAGDPPTLALRSNVKVFKTTSTLLVGCRQVRSWNELRQLVEDAVVAAVEASPLVRALNQINVAAQVICPVSNPDTSCVAARLKQANLNGTSGAYPTMVALDAFLGQIQALRDDAIAFKIAQGW